MWLIVCLSALEYKFQEDRNSGIFSHFWKYQQVTTIFWLSEVSFTFTKGSLPPKILKHLVVFIHTQIGIDICCCLVAKLYPTLSRPLNCSPPSSSVHGIFQERKKKWVSISFFGGSFRARKVLPEPASPALAGRFFITEPPWKANRYIHTHIDTHCICICLLYIHVCAHTRGEYIEYIKNMVKSKHWVFLE